jgi:hypothetical protein
MSRTREDVEEVVTEFNVADIFLHKLEALQSRWPAVKPSTKPGELEHEFEATSIEHNVRCYRDHALILQFLRVVLAWRSLT